MKNFKTLKLYFEHRSLKVDTFQYCYLHQYFIKVKSTKVENFKNNFIFYILKHSNLKIDTILICEKTGKSSSQKSK